MSRDQMASTTLAAAANHPVRGVGFGLQALGFGLQASGSQALNDFGLGADAFEPRAPP